jgi:hypothetical protein
VKKGVSRARKKTFTILGAAVRAKILLGRFPAVDEEPASGRNRG